MPANNTKFPENEYFFPSVGESSRLLVGCTPEDYSASRIARAVEDCDAHLLNLNITSMGKRDDLVSADKAYPDDNFPVIFDLRINQRNASAVRRSLERYGYSVLDAQSSDDSDLVDDIARQRIEEFFRYLEI